MFVQHGEINICFFIQLKEASLCFRVISHRERLQPTSDCPSPLLLGHHRNAQIRHFQRRGWRCGGQEDPCERPSWGRSASGHTRASCGEGAEAG